jgi:hypothetical protein
MKRISQIVVLVVVAMAARSGMAQCDMWESVGNSNLPPDSVIRAITSYNGDLIVGGEFTSIGGVGANNIARWDGSLWHPLGAGINGLVLDMTVYDGQLIVVGNFDSAGSVSANHVARWNGATWQTMGAGFTNIGNAVHIHNGQLFASGFFVTSGSTVLNRVGRWNGSAWVPVGGGVNDGCLGLASHAGDLIALGWFQEAEGNPAARIARWNGASWQPIGEGLVSDVGHGSTAISYNGTLFAGGAISSPPAREWTGSSWIPFGPLSSGVRRMTTYVGDLVIAGGFSTIDGMTVNSIARWDGTEFIGFGQGVSGGTVNDAYEHGDWLYIGGTFTGAGGKPIQGLARWRDCASFSCAGNCGGQAPGGCWCDSGCFGFEDCCDDVCFECALGPCSCEGHCNGQNAAGGCWCDNACFGAGDCCADVCTQCSDLGGCQGACCLADGSCEQLSEIGCIVSGGTFAGEGVACASVDCAPSTSCVGMCGGTAPSGCWCDDSCIGFGDCCEDACEACDVAGCQTSCNSHCGGQAPGGCWCDLACFGANDCCSDVCSWCPGSPCACTGDLNGDVVVNVSDLLILLSGWGSCNPDFYCQADLNGDGVVNVSDLLILLSAWGACEA